MYTFPRDIFLIFLLVSLVFGDSDPTTTTSTARSVANVNANVSEVDQIPLPPWDRYLKSVSEITLDDKNKEYKKFLENVSSENIFKPETIKTIMTGFDRFVPQEIKVKLNHVKQKEIDAIRRRLIPVRKNLAHNLEMPTHLNMSHLQFTSEDLGLLIKANGEHLDKFHELRENNYKQFQMEKKFLEKQRLKHAKTEEKREKEKEKIKLEKERLAMKNMSQPLSPESAKQIWEEKDNLGKDEFNSRTFFAIHDIDSNGFLDMNEVRMLLHKQYDEEDNSTEARKVMKENLEKHLEDIFQRVDVNGDLLIDFKEYTQTQTKSVPDKNTTNSEEDSYDDTEFEKYEKERIDQIRDDFAKGKKPEGYNYEDVPLLGDNFINETHISYNGVLLKTDDTSPALRKQMYKEYVMNKQFEMEQNIAHIQDPLQRRAAEVELEIEKKRTIKVHQPLSQDQLKTTWEDEDQKNESDFHPEEFFHLHDINSDGVLNKQEVRFLLLSELKEEYGKQNRSMDTPEFAEYLERMKDDVFETADTNKDGVVDMQEFLGAVEKNKQRQDEIDQKKQNWKILHEQSDFSEEEYKEFHDKKVLEIRQLIVDGRLPSNYNYTDIPMLSDNFINSTHIMRNGNLINFHKEVDMPQRIRDFKRYRMEARYKFEEGIKNLNEEDQARERAKYFDHQKELKAKRDSIPAPLSEDQDKEVWEKDDKMNPDEFTLQKYFILHDVDGSGTWERSEVIASLMSELETFYNKTYAENQEEMQEELDSWLNYVYKTGDLNEDGLIDFKELEHINKIGRERNKNGTSEWENVDEKQEYTEEEFKQFQNESHKEA